jgi:hypothetical protein
VEQRPGARSNQPSGALLAPLAANLDSDLRPSGIETLESKCLNGSFELGLAVQLRRDLFLPALMADGSPGRHVA